MTMAQDFPTPPGRVGDAAQRTGTWRARLLSQLIAGRQLKVDDAQVSEFTRYLSLGDPLADALIAHYQALPAGEGRRMTERALQHGIDSVPDAPAPLRALFAQLDTVPIWVDREKLNLGADVILRTGAFSELVLRNVSLMGGYLASAAAKPLMFTGQLDRMAQRRLLETGKFWMDVNRRDGMERFADGFKSTVHVRLMHAQVRHMLLKSGRWNEAEWGHPINQSDAMATILEFSMVLLLGLKVLGFRFSSEEREAVVHLWRYVGYLIGVDERILPTCEQDAVRAMWLQYLTFAPSDDDARELGQALHRVPFQQAGDHPLKKIFARMESGYRAAYSRLMLTNAGGDALGLPKAPLGTVAVAATAPIVYSLETLRRLMPGGTELAVTLGRRFNESGFQAAVAIQKVKADFVAVKQLAR